MTVKLAFKRLQLSLITTEIVTFDAGIKPSEVMSKVLIEVFASVMLV